jgi:hypothetical protein
MLSPKSDACSRKRGWVVSDVLSPDQLEHTLKNIGNPMTNGDLLRRHIATLEKERDAALADNAALVTGVQRIRNLVAYPTLSARDTLSAVADVGLSLVVGDHPGAALPEEHRKALVRARNEGLEKAAADVDRLASIADVSAEQASNMKVRLALAEEAAALRDHAVRIRAMKEPESGPHEKVKE